MTKYFALTLILIAGAVFAKPGKIVTGTVYIKNGTLNVRVKPGKEYFIVATFLTLYR